MLIRRRREPEVNLYNILADHYGELFPLDPARTAYVLETASVPEPRILDLGCATGDLDFALAERGARAAGVDLNERMIARALERLAENPELKGRLSFHAGDMTLFPRDSSLPGDGRYYGAVCFGNTLPHLKDPAAVEGFFRTVRGALLPGGSFTVQILNYDRIAKEKPRELGLMETENLVFRRYYDYMPEGTIRFRAELILPKEGITLGDSTLLYPLKRREITEAARQAGFSRTAVLGSYAGEPAGPDSPVLLFRLED